MNADIDITGVLLRTERLLIRPWRREDLEDFFAYASVEGVGEAAGWIHHQSVNETSAVLDRFIENKKTFALDLGGRVVGSLGIEKYDEARFPAYDSKKCRELGFVLAKDQWGRGLMTEAVREVLRWLFEEKGFDAVFCSHFLDNRRSGALQKKCGFVHAALGRYETKWGEIKEDETNILTRERYFLLKQTQN